MQNLLSIIESKICCSCHSCKISLSMRAIDWRCDELLIWKPLRVALLHKDVKSILTNLMPKTARTGMNQDIGLTLMNSPSLCDIRKVDLLDFANFNKMVARADRP